VATSPTSAAAARSARNVRTLTDDVIAPARAFAHRAVKVQVHVPPSNQRIQTPP